MLSIVVLTALSGGSAGVDYYPSCGIVIVSPAPAHPVSVPVLSPAPTIYYSIPVVPAAPASQPASTLPATPIYSPGQTPAPVPGYGPAPVDPASPGQLFYPASPSTPYYVPTPTIPANPGQGPMPIIPTPQTPMPEPIRKLPTPAPGDAPAFPKPSVPGTSPRSPVNRDETRELVNHREPPVEMPTPDQARLIVDVPADARLFVHNQPTHSTAGRRSFVTPQLNPDKTYCYELRVELVRAGQPMTEYRHVFIRAGEVARASFLDLDRSSIQAARK